MNLLQLLLGSLTSESSVNSLVKKTGISSKLISKLIVMAVPLLIRYMTKNASSQSGAQSLLSALTQHTNKRSMAEQIDEVDEEDPTLPARSLPRSCLVFPYRQDIQLLRYSLLLRSR